MTYHAQQGVDTCIARIFNTYGPRMRRNDGRASVQFINQAIAGKPLTVYGDGSQTRSLCYVDDLIRGLYLLAIERRAPAGQPRQPGSRGDDARARADGDPRLRLDERGRVRGAADRRSADPPARHHPRARVARLGARDRPRGGPRALAAGARPRAGRRAEACVAGGPRGRRRRDRDRSRRPRGRPHASRYLRVGIYDEAQTLYGPVDQTFATLQAAARPGDPAEPLLGRQVRRREDAGPRIADEPERPRVRLVALRPHRRPTRRRRHPRPLLDLRHAGVGERRQGDERRADAARPTCATSRSPPRRATAARSSAPDGTMLPTVREWLAWNEPNNPVFLAPQYKRSRERLDDGRARRPTPRSATPSTTASTATLLASERVACGGTAPRGNNNPSSSRPSVSPLAFLRAVKTAGLKTFDAWAHHPYYSEPTRHADDQAGHAERRAGHRR